MHVLDREEMGFGYRASHFLHRRELVLTEVRLQLTLDAAENIRERVGQASKKKQQTQPLTYPSAGCVFKNPPHYSAGYLIQNAGCLGMRIGDAQVSFQHGNFIINKGKATAHDIIELMEMVREKVKAQFGIQLEPEIEIL
jgi:UDP-N-acetylmuramate dehydrogenase